jgi:hypothetical protein
LLVILGSKGSGVQGLPSQIPLFPKQWAEEPKIEKQKHSEGLGVYLALKYINGKTHYFIRESYRQAKLFLSRDLIALGTDPGQYIVYPGGNSFYVDTAIEERLSGLGVEADQDALEKVFWGFLSPEIKRALEPFRRRAELSRRSRGVEKQRKPLDTPVHIFDQRRIHFLKFGQINQRGIGRLPQGLLRVLHRKSRDEIEQAFLDMETVLAPREYKTYTYAIFNLQQFFHESFAKRTPQMLNQSQVDDHFIEQVCALNQDPSFWAGMPTDDRLHEYLRRYVCMYFDNDFAPGSLSEDYIRNFMNSRREYRPPDQTGKISLKAASILFGESQETLHKLSRSELARRYRRQALKLHPDQGGDHEKFVKLTEAYHRLLRSKK